MTIGQKILGGFVLALVALLLIGGVAELATQQLLEAISKRRHAYEVLLAIERLREATTDAETGQRGFIITGSDPYLAPYRTALTKFDERLKALRTSVGGDDLQRQRAAKMETLIRGKLAELKTTIDLRRTSFAGALEVVQTGAGDLTMEEIRKTAAQMRVEEELKLKQATNATDAAARWTHQSIIFSTAACALVLLIGGSKLARNIAGPFAKITGMAERIALGDLNEELATIHRSDEVGVLSRAFCRMNGSLREMAVVAGRVSRGDLTVGVTPQSADDVLGKSFATMIERLREVMRDITEAVQVLAGSSTEIMAATIQLAASAAETAVAVQETTTTIEEVKQTSKHSSEKARFVSEEAQKAVDISQGGKRAVTQMTEGMGGIRVQMSAVAECILSLSTQSQAIGDIIATVDDVAAQSKLLAVNAAIEAAKAGEEGKGFAVVAEEVRTLAEQSKQATTQVRLILNQIQNATSSAVLAAELASKTIEAGVRQSTSAGESIGALAENVAAAAQAATQIAATSQEQLAGMGQVAIAMENIHTASGQTLVSTKQAESAAQQLHVLGQKLKELVERFKV